MMTQDPIGDLSMKPTRDELAQRQNPRSRTKGGGSPRRPPGRPPQQPVKQSSSTGMLWLLLLAMMAGSGAGGWFLWQKVEMLQTHLTDSTQALDSAESMLSSLQSNVNDTDKSLSQTGSQVSADIKVLNQEVRKLWDLSNKRNKKSIEAQQAQLKKLQSELSASNGNLAGLMKRVNGDSAKFASFSKNIKELQEQNGTLSKVVDSQKSEMGTFRSLVGSAADFEDRITILEADIQAIDSYRQQINRRLDQLDKELIRLSQPPPSPEPAPGV